MCGIELNFGASEQTPGGNLLHVTNPSLNSLKMVHEECTIETVKDANLYLTEFEWQQTPQSARQLFQIPETFPPAAFQPHKMFLFNKVLCSGTRYCLNEKKTKTFASFSSHVLKMNNPI